MSVCPKGYHPGGMIPTTGYPGVNPGIQYTVNLGELEAITGRT